MAAPTTYRIQRGEDGSVVIVTLCRAACLDIDGKRELTALFHSLEDEADVRAVIVRAEHREAFLVDVTELVEMTSAQALDYARAGQTLMRAVEALSVPVIVAVDGPALGGGCEFVLAADLALAAPAAVFGQVETAGGVVPAFGGTWRLARRVGFQSACRLIFTAAPIDAEHAQQLGLVAEVVDAAELDAVCEALAAQIAGNAPAAVAEAKRILHGGFNQTPQLAEAMEQAAFAGLFQTPEQTNRMRAFLATGGSA